MLVIRAFLAWKQPFSLHRWDEAREASALSSRRGVAILLLLCLVQFMDVLDASILNIALPSIERDLHFSQQSLQWVVSGYILTYGAGSCCSVVAPPISSAAASSSAGWSCSPARR